MAAERGHFHAPPPREDNDASGFVRFYRANFDDENSKTLEKDDDTNNKTLRFFNRKNDGWSAHGEDAMYVARRFYKTTTVVKYLKDGECTLPSVNVNQNLFETICRDVLLRTRERTVEVYESERGNAKDFKLTRRGSPGNVLDFEDVLFDGSKENDLNAMTANGNNIDTDSLPIVCAVKCVLKQEQRRIGLAFFEYSTRTLRALEFSDEERLGQLESILAQINAREVIVPNEVDKTNGGAMTADAKRIADVIDRCDAMRTPKANSEYFRTDDVEDDLKRVLKSGDNVQAHRNVLDLPLAVQCLHAVMKFADISNDTQNHGRCELELFDSGAHVRLDAAALKALNVFPSSGAGGGDRSFGETANGRKGGSGGFSLYNLLNRCTSPMGKRVLYRWLKQPLVSVEKISERHDVVETFSEESALRDSLRNAHLKSLPDVERLARKLEKKKTSLMDLCKLYQASSAIPHAVDCLERIPFSDETKKALFVSKYILPLKECMEEEKLGKFEALIEHAVDLNKIPDEYVISAEFDDTLGLLEQQKKSTEEEINVVWQEAAEDLTMERDKQLKLEKNNQHGYFFRLTKKDETMARSKLSKSAQFQILEAKKDGSKFTNKKLRALSQKRLDIDRTYEAKQKHLVQRVLDVAVSFVDIFLKASSVMAELDVLCAFAEVAQTAPTPYIRPQMTNADEKELVLLDSRHPLVETQDSCGEFVQNSCKMMKGESWFQIITGPNMGGKSTFIRQVGVNVLLAQVGSFVPCSKAIIPVRDAIFCRIGAGDFQLRGVSTFMAEMLESASILRSATEKSLVIIDELGRGTSTYDGFGLAWGIAEHLANEVKAPCLFATHFHELTELKGDTGVKNFHVSAKIDVASKKIAMLYALEEGACDQSFGIHCAEFSGFPAEALEDARKCAEELENGNISGNKENDRSDVDDADATYGRKRAMQFLYDFKNIPLPQLAPSDVIERVKKLKTELERDASASKWLQNVFEDINANKAA
jgi:DNA mismatch repair protein MSH2|tara:strand:- start:295 stop:3267 length:2973 start_codon:yes stop_codon:yes gene_type:complete